MCFCVWVLKCSVLWSIVESVRTRKSTIISLSKLCGLCAGAVLLSVDVWQWQLVFEILSFVILSLVVPCSAEFRSDSDPNLSLRSSWAVAVSLSWVSESLTSCFLSLVDSWFLTLTSEPRLAVPIPIRPSSISWLNLSYPRRSKKWEEK